MADRISLRKARGGPVFEPPPRDPAAPVPAAPEPDTVAPPEVSPAPPLRNPDRPQGDSWQQEPQPGMILHAERNVRDRTNNFHLRFHNLALVGGFPFEVMEMMGRPGETRESVAEYWAQRLAEMFVSHLQGDLEEGIKRLIMDNNLIR